MIAQNSRNSDVAGGRLEAKSPPIHGLRAADASGIADPFSRDDDDDQWSVKTFGSNGGSILRALGITQGGDDEISRPYYQNPWVWACINAWVRAATCVPMVIRRSDNPESDEVTDGPLFRLFQRPNPLLTQRKTLRLQTIYHLLDGECFWFMAQRRQGKNGLEMVHMEDRGSGSIDVPDEVWLITGSRVEMVQDELTKLPIAWKYQAGQDEVVFPSHSVVQFYQPDPYSPFRGVGPMTAAMRTVAQDFASERFNEALLANGGMPNGVFESERPLSPPERQMLKESFREQQGRPEKHRTPLVTEYGLKWNQSAWSPQDMEFRELKLWLRDTIMSVFGVTKPVIGITDDVNRANAQEAMRAFWEVTILPYLDFLEDELNNNFLARIAGPESGYRIMFDTAVVDALRESADHKIERVTSLMGIGRSFNEAASMADMEIEEEVEGGDERYVPSSWTRVDADAPELAQPAPAGPTSAEEGDPQDDRQDDPEKFAQKAAEEPRVKSGRDRAARALLAKKADEDIRPVVAQMSAAVQKTVRQFALSARKEIADYAAGEDKAAEAVEKATPEQVERVLRRLIASTAGRWSDSFIAAIDPGYKGAFRVGAQDAASQTGGSPISVDLPEFASALVQRKRDALQAVSTTLQDEVFRLVRAVLDEAEPLASESVRALLRRTEAEWRPRFNKLIQEAAFRSERIARTETTSVSNWTRVEQMKEDGIERHEWLTNEDEFVRSSHAELDGRVVEIGKEFGHGLKQPGDEDAPVGERVNCRCALAPVIDDEDEE